jgi:Ca-activated chloride channel family protein
VSIHPIMPVPLLLVVFALLAGFVGWQLARRDNRSRRMAWVLRAVMVLLVLLIALRPVLPGGGGAPQATTDVDVFFVVDTTTSIVAEDWDGDSPRLDGVKEDIAGLVSAYPGAKFALLTFDSSAVLRVPLTSDASAVSNTAQVMGPEITLYSAGSSISEANELLASTLGRAEEAEPDRARIVYYFGDGEQTSSSPAGDFVFGYGTEEGGRMRVQTGYYDDDKTDDGYVSDDSGGDARSVIDEQNLRKIADQLGVDYAHRQPSVDAPVASAPGGYGGSEANGPGAGTIELYWLPAAALFVLLAMEAAGVIVRLREIRSAARRGRGVS